MFIQFSWPASSNSWINAIQACSQTPCSSHSDKRRQQVLGEGYCAGRSFQRAPLRKTHKMPSKHRRFATRLRPPLTEIVGFGKSGSTWTPCASVSSGSCRVMKNFSFHDALLS
jgi:hypothetical protein